MIVDSIFSQTTHRRDKECWTFVPTQTRLEIPQDESSPRHDWKRPSMEWKRIAILW